MVLARNKMASVEEFLAVKNIAVVGASDNPDKYGYKIYRNLKSRGYNVYPVNNKSQTVDGDKVYQSIDELPPDVEAVDIVVPPQAATKVIQECANKGINLIWLQPGAESPQNLKLGKELGLSIIHSTCVMLF